MRKEHTRRMFAWMKQVRADPKLTHFDSVVGSAIADHTYAETGRAEVTEARLARDVVGTPRGIRNSLKRLAKRDHLRIERKPGKKNHYFPNLLESEGGRT